MGKYTISGGLLFSMIKRSSLAFLRSMPEKNSRTRKKRGSNFHRKWCNSWEECPTCFNEELDVNGSLFTKGYKEIEIFKRPFVPHVVLEKGNKNLGHFFCLLFSFTLSILNTFYHLRFNTLLWPNSSQKREECPTAFKISLMKCGIDFQARASSSAPLLLVFDENFSRSYDSACVIVTFHTKILVLIFGWKNIFCDYFIPQLDGQSSRVV